MKRLKLGEILLKAGLISPEILENALKIQKGRNKRLGKVLIEMGYVDEAQVAEVLSQQLMLPLVNCEDYAVPSEVLSLVPKEMAEIGILFPLEMTGKKLLIAMADPSNWQIIDDLSFKTGLHINTAVSTETSIISAIENHYGSSLQIWDLLKKFPATTSVEFVKEDFTEQSEEQIQSLYKDSEAPPIIKLVTMVVADALKARASDIHLEPKEDHVQVRYRIDGDLRYSLKYPRHIHESVISRIKIISNLDITNRRLPQDGRCSLRSGSSKIDLRISTLPSVYGEKIVIRLLDRTTGIIPISNLGVQANVLSPFLELINKPQGMILVTGPTGSGKTTTLYGILQQLQTEKENLITIEDPVEYKLPGITQVGINEAIGLTFDSILRSILRQDPDIIMVGEIRDYATAEIALKAALTGHLVFSTLHTNDTVSTITRLVDLKVEPFLISAAVTGILAQRLLKRICPQCIAKVRHAEKALKPSFPPLQHSFKGAGCKECQYTGYKGRVGIYEFLQLTTQFQRLIMKQASEDQLWEAARDAGTVTLFDDAWAKVDAGITTVEEVIAKIPYRH